MLVLLIAGTVLSVPLVSLAMPATGTVEITGPAGITRIDPQVDASYRVQGRGGTVLVVARAGEVYVAESSCPDGVCMRSGTLAAGKPLVCAPNGVVVAYESGRGAALDAISR